jgi:glutathione synthase/RimK-type ligase-like ATP-grasp enzyme
LSVIILTPDMNGEWAGARWPSVLERMVAPLFSAGIGVESRSWTAAGDLSSAPLVLPLLAWGYHQSGQGWHNQVQALEEEGVTLHNPASVLHWNADKLYLEGLSAKGAPVVPTRFVARVGEEALLDAAAAFGTDQLVIKPQVSAGAWRTIRWSPGAPFGEGPEGAAMIQPYLPSIETGGEISLIYFGGRFSHAIRKRPQPGDFRVQPEYDGIITAHQPAADEIEAADAALAAVEESLLYARVDLVRGLDGRPKLIELELIEPDLYLGYDADAPTRFAAAVKALL